MEVLIVGSGFEGIHFLLHEEHLPQIIIFNENRLAVGYREVSPSDLVDILKEIPPNNDEFLIKKLSPRNEDEFIVLLEKEPTEQHTFFCFEINVGDQNGCRSITTKNCCRSRGPPRAEYIILFPLFFIPLFWLKKQT